MGLNFHVRCKTHRVVGMVPRGRENEVLHQFYSDHLVCRRNNPSAVEVQADEESEQDWMRRPLPDGYTELDLFT